MALGDTYVIPCKRYIMDDTAKTAEYVDDVNFYLPYASVGYLSTSLYLIYYGLITDYYGTVDGILNQALLTNLGEYNGTAYTDYPNTAVTQYYPNLKPVDVGDANMALNSLLLVNKMNNRVLRTRTPDSNYSSDGRRTIIYPSLNDALNDANIIYQTNSSRMFPNGPNSSSGGTLGNISCYVYIDGYYDSVNNVPNRMMRWVFNGARSTTNSFRYSGNNTNSDHAYILQNWIANGGITPVVPPTPGGNDPYSPGGNTQPGGGGGTQEDTTEPVDIPSLPTDSPAVDTNFISLFSPTLTEMRNLANFMWTDPLFDLSNWRRIFADPMDAILGLSIIPVDVPTGTPRAVTVGNISTGVNMTPATAQFVEVNCGSISVAEFWGAYLDYAPYTKAELYLPYCGIHPIDIDDIMGKTIEIKYHVDILSGACCAYVKCGDSVLYSYIGQCSASIPITGNDWTNVINGVISASVSIGTMIATGGASAPLSVAGMASTAVNGMKPSIERSGAMSGVGGIMAIQKPYLIISRPKQALPENQNAYTGYPSFITATLSDLTGYTEVEKIHLDNVHATSEELAEIESLLKSGVLL